MPDPTLAIGRTPEFYQRDPRLDLRCTARPASTYSADCPCWKCCQKRVATEKKGA